MSGPATHQGQGWRRASSTGSWRESEPGDPHHLFERGRALGQLAQRRLAQGAYAVLHRLALDLRGVGAVDDQVLDRVVDRQDLEDAGAPQVAGAAALEATLALVHLDALALGHGEPQHRRLVGLEVALAGATGVDLA